MAGIAGRKARVRLATTLGGTYNVIQGIRQITYGIDGAEIDDSEFGNDFMQRLIGAKDFKLTLTGNLRPADTTGQNLLRSSQLDDSDIFIKVLPDNGTTSGIGYQCQMRVAKVGGGSDMSGAAEFTCELVVTGTVTIV